MKPICGHRLYTRYGPYVENDACNFCEHIKDSPYVLVGKSGWQESSYTSSSTFETENMGDRPNKVISVSISTPSYNVDNSLFAAFENQTKGIGMKLLTCMGYDGRGLRGNGQHIINLLKVKEQP